MPTSTEMRPDPPEDTATATEPVSAAPLLVKIGRLPEPTQRLVHQYIDAVTSDIEERLARCEQTLAGIAARVDMAPGAWPNLSGRYWPVSS